MKKIHINPEKENLNAYMAFHTVVKYGGMKRASIALSITQSALSHAISRLEDRLGCSLFLRKGKQLALTQEGSKLYLRTQTIAKALQLFERDLLEEENSSTLTIACAHAPTKFFLLSKIKAFSKLHPKLRFVILSFSLHEAIQKVVDHQVDLGFALTPFIQQSLPESIHFEEVGRFKDVFIAGAAYDFLKGRELNLKDTMDYPLIGMTSDLYTRSFQDLIFQQNGLHFEPQFETSFTDLMVDMAAAGMGLALVPDFVLRDSSSGRGNEIFPILLKEELPEHKILLINNKSLSNNSITQEFIKFLLRVS